MQRDITERKKETKGKDDCTDLVDKKTKLENECKALEKLSDELVSRRDKTLGKIGNILHESVPVSQDEEKDNKVVSMWGTPRSFGSLKIQTDGFRPHESTLRCASIIFCPARRSSSVRTRSRSSSWRLTSISRDSFFSRSVLSKVHRSRSACSRAMSSRSRAKTRRRQRMARAKPCGAPTGSVSMS